MAFLVIQVEVFVFERNTDSRAQARGEKGKWLKVPYGTEFAMGSGATVGAGLAEAYDPTMSLVLSLKCGGFIGAYTFCNNYDLPLRF